MSRDCHIDQEWKAENNREQEHNISKDCIYSYVAAKWGTHKGTKGAQAEELEFTWTQRALGVLLRYLAFFWIGSGSHEGLIYMEWEDKQVLRILFISLIQSVEIDFIWGHVCLSCLSQILSNYPEGLSDWIILRICSVELHNPSDKCRDCQPKASPYLDHIQFHLYVNMICFVLLCFSHNIWISTWSFKKI